MAEALVLAMLGSAVGLGMAVAVAKLVRSLDPAALPRLEGVTTDWRVGLAILSLIVFTSALFAAFPMIERMRLRSSGALLGDRGGVGSPRAVKVGRGLVIVQTTLAVAVLVSAVFLADTFQRLQHADIGFDPERIISARVAMFTQAPGRSPEQYFGNVVDAIEQISGVDSSITVCPQSNATAFSSIMEDSQRGHVSSNTSCSKAPSLMAAPSAASSGSQSNSQSAHSTVAADCVYAALRRWLACETAMLLVS